MAILGIRDTVSFESDRFQNWRRQILYLFPAGSSPLTALLSLTEPEETNDPHFNWYQKALPTQRSTLTASYIDSATSIAVAAANFRVGHQLLNELTNEIMEVIAVSSDGLTLTVNRGIWGTAVASSGSADPIVVIGNINAEGGSSPQALSNDPSPKVNLTQIFRNPLELTGTAQVTSVKWDRTGPYKERLRDALEQSGMEQEKAYIWSKQAEWNDPADGKVKRTTGGILSFMPDGYKLDPADSNGAVTDDEWEGWLELAFRYGANERLVLTGSGALKAVNKLARKMGEIQTVTADDAFGLAVVKWITPYGTLYLKTHPLFTQHPSWRFAMLFLQVTNLKYRHMINRDLHRRTNIQANDADARKDEFFAESGLEVHHAGSGSTEATAAEGTFLYLTNIKDAALAT